MWLISVSSVLQGGRCLHIAFNADEEGASGGARISSTYLTCGASH
jgi:hypothetical protein